MMTAAKTAKRRSRMCTQAVIAALEHLGAGPVSLEIRKGGSVLLRWDLLLLGPDPEASS